MSQLSGPTLTPIHGLGGVAVPAPLWTSPTVDALSAHSSQRRSTSSKGSKSSSSSSRLRGLYGWGSSNTGQLGGGGAESKERLVPAVIPGFEKVALFDCSGSHSIVVKRGENKSTEVYAFGRNDAGQCGIAQEDTPPSAVPKAVFNPTLIESLNVHRIIFVACGGAHTAAVTSQGAVFTWGWGMYGQLGHGPDIKELAQPKEVSDLHGIFITQVSCGGFHTAMVTKMKALYTCGMGTYGQLGLGDVDNRFSPHLVTALEGTSVTEVSCGETHMTALSSKGDCYTWGSGDAFQLGHGEKTNELVPRRIESFRERGTKIVKICCGYRHTVGVSEDGFAFSWGTGDHGELGLGDAERVKTVPTLIDALGSTTIRSVHASMHFTAFLTDTGDVFLCGSRLLGHSSTSANEFQMTPKRLAVFGEQYVMSLRAGTHHCIAYIDSGDVGRNRIVGRIVSTETRYVRALLLVAKAITPVAASLVGEETWQEVVWKMDAIFDFHRKLVLKKLRRMLNSGETPFKISSIYLNLFADVGVLKTYSEYASRVSDGWEHFLGCLKARPELGTYLERIFATPMFAHCGLIKANRSPEQFNAFLQMPTSYFGELVPLFEDLLRATKEASTEYSAMKKLVRKAKESAQLVKSSMENDAFVRFMEFLQKYPDGDALVQSHRRYLGGFPFALTDGAGYDGATHGLFLFNDVVVITDSDIILHQFELFNTFTKDIAAAFFQLIAPNYTYNVFCENEKEKTKILQAIQEATANWIEQRPKLRDARVLAGINMLMGDLQQVMPLVSKDWSGTLLPVTPRSSNSSLGRSGGSRALSRRPSSGTDTSEKQMIQSHQQNLLSSSSVKLNSLAITQSLTDISDLLSRTSLALEKEGLRRERNTQALRTAYTDLQEKFVIMLDFGSMTASTQRSSVASSISRAFGRKRKSTAFLGPASSLRALGRNFKIAVRVSGDTRVAAAKEALYNAARNSPWASSYEFASLSQYALRIRGLGMVLLTEDLPLSRIPVVQTIVSTTFVTPTIEMILRPNTREPIPKVNFESELHTFEQITALIGTTKSLINTQSDEVNSFRHASAAHRLKIYALRQTQPATRDRFRWPEYKGLEALPLVLPSTLNITIYLPSLNYEKHTIQVAPSDTVLLICQRIWRYLYKHDKHRGREKFKKFFKNIMDTDDAAASDSSDEIERQSEASSTAGGPAPVLDDLSPPPTNPTELKEIPDSGPPPRSKGKGRKKSDNNLTAELAAETPMTTTTGSAGTAADEEKKPSGDNAAPGEDEDSQHASSAAVSRKESKRRASLRTVLEFMKKDDKDKDRIGSGASVVPATDRADKSDKVDRGLTVSVTSPGGTVAATDADGGGTTPTKTPKKRNFMVSMFGTGASGSPSRTPMTSKKTSAATQAAAPAPSSVPTSPAQQKSMDDLFESSTYHGSSNNTPRTKTHRKTHSDDTNMTSGSDAETLRRSISRGTKLPQRMRSGSIADEEDSSLSRRNSEVREADIPNFTRGLPTVSSILGKKHRRRGSVPDPVIGSTASTGSADDSPRQQSLQSSTDKVNRKSRAETSAELPHNRVPPLPATPVLVSTSKKSSPSVQGTPSTKKHVSKTSADVDGGMDDSSVVASTTTTFTISSSDPTAVTVKKINNLKKQSSLTRSAVDVTSSSKGIDDAPLPGSASIALTETLKKKRYRDSDVPMTVSSASGTPSLARKKRSGDIETVSIASAPEHGTPSPAQFSPSRKTSKEFLAQTAGQSEALRSSSKDKLTGKAVPPVRTDMSVTFGKANHQTTTTEDETTRDELSDTEVRSSKLTPHEDDDDDTNAGGTVVRPDQSDEIAAALLGVADPESAATIAAQAASNVDEEGEPNIPADPNAAASVLDPEKQKKMRKEEEKLRKEKEKEEKKIKKEEEKLRKEKEKEEKKKLKKEQKEVTNTTSPNAAVDDVPSVSSKEPASVEKEHVPEHSNKEKDRKEKEDHKDKSKKTKSAKQPKQKKLSTGKTFEDFILKVYGSREFLLPGESSALNKLIDYDYICKCINNSTQIDLVYVDKYAVAVVEPQSGVADADEALIDGAIARDLSDNVLSEVFLPTTIGNPSQNQSQQSTPFWAFDADLSQFSVRALDCLNLDIEPEYLKGSRAAVFLACGIYNGGVLTSPLQLTTAVPASTSPTWNEDLVFDIVMKNIPLESRLCMTLYLRTDMNKLNRSRILRSDQPLAWVSVQIFDHNGEIRCGEVSFRMWTGQAANPIGTCSENVSSDSPPVLYMELYSNKSDTPNSTVRSLPKSFSTSPPPASNTGGSLLLRKTASGIALGYGGPRHKEHEATAEEIEELKSISHRDSLSTLSDAEKELLWNNLAWCKKHPSILPKLLLAVDWTDRPTVSHVHRLLESWPLLHPMDALQLLDFKFPDRQVRNFAVRCLELMNDNDLYRILLQLTQALKFEPYHDSALAHFLIKRAFLDQARVGHFFFWQLKSELDASSVSERFSLLLESYLKSCGRNTRELLLAQNDVLSKLHRIAMDIKSMKRGPISGASLDDRRNKLQQMLRDTHWPKHFLSPLDPRVECSGFIIEKCKVLGSKTLPLWLAFENVETGEPHYIIYKVGDDLRQDQLTLQIIALMDDLWKREGVDLKLKPYSTMAIGDNHGLIEVVKNANTTSNINIELGGVRAVYNDATLVKWLKKHNPTDKLYAKAVETFLLSCAGYSVITFALGFADRHNDNIMLTKQGNLFHIDFGHFLGHYRKLFGMKYVDKAELVFIPQYYAVIGKDNFERFERTCTQAYNVIRRYANYFITLFSLMLSSGLPEVQTVDDIRFMQERLRLDLTDDDAAESFKQILQDAQANSTIKLNHAFHVLYQGMRS